MSWAERYQQAKSWDEATRVLMLASKSLDVLQADERIAEYKVEGCESSVWMMFSCVQDRVKILSYSDGKIVRGLLYLIIEPVQGQSLRYFKSYDYDGYLHDLALQKYLSPSRNNGVANLIQRLKKLQLTLVL